MKTDPNLDELTEAIDKVWTDMRLMADTIYIPVSLALRILRPTMSKRAFRRLRARLRRRA